MVHLGVPFCLAQMTMRWHHVTGSPIGTGSKTPSLTSRSRPTLTASCQCKGTGMGECTDVVSGPQFFSPTCSGLWANSSGPLKMTALDRLWTLLMRCYDIVDVHYRRCSLS